MTIKLSENDKSSIDSWLNHLQKHLEAAHKYWQVTVALNAKWKQTGERIFPIPHNKLLGARAFDYENIQDILTKFHQLDIAFTTYNKETVVENKKIVSKDNLDTSITIVPEALEYFHDKLELIVKPELNTPKPLPIPPDWQLELKGKGALLTFQKKLIIHFKSIKDNRYRYFKCLWGNHLLEVSSKILFEYDSGLKYEPKKGEAWRVNKNINRTIDGLKNEIYDKFEKDKSPLTITVDKSHYKLAIS